MSGIDALLLEGGRTVHSRSKLPTPLPFERAKELAPTSVQKAAQQNCCVIRL